MDKRGDEQFKRILQEKEREALQPIKEDLATWLSALLDVQITASTFMDELKSAVLLCRLAKLIQQASAARMSPVAPRVSQEKIHIDLPAKNASNMFHDAVARSNAAKFISWCKNVEGVHIIFESEDLVKQRDERSVILCILDLARVAAKVEMESPELVKMEREIEADEKEADAKEATEEHKSDASSHEEAAEEQKRGASSHALDEKDKQQVFQQFNQCTCQQKIKVVSYGGGKFQITIDRKIHILYTRALRDRVMVRTGGGWDTLDHFLLKHDPCRHKFKDLDK